MKKPFVIHPFLFAIYFILFLFTYNVNELSFSQIIFPLAIVLGFTFLFMWLSKFIFKDNIKGGIIVSLFLVMFFSYGYIYDIIVGTQLGNFLIGRHIYLLLMWCIVYICSNYFIIKKQQKSLYNFTKILNVIAFTLILISLFNVGIYNFNLISNQQEKNIHTEDKDNNARNLEIKTPLRDIYYIILDSYASSRTLMEFFNYDNSEFTDYLIDEGFFVATKSHSNYYATQPSLASSLNMEYMEYVNSLMLVDNKVMRFLKSKGYKYIHFSSGRGPTDYNKFADLNIWGGYKLDEFSMFLSKTTILGPIMRNFDRDRILGTFSKLEKLDQIIEPKFVFAHIYSPHMPYIFKANGDPVKINLLESAKGIMPTKEKELYLNQLIFVSKKIEALVKEILLKSEVAPIIILQADHGPGKFILADCEHPTEEFLKGRMNIFNAYYLPGGGNEVLYNSITPVNTFRLIFNFYFGTNYKLLEDRSYAENIDVTDKVKYD